LPHSFHNPGLYIRRTTFPSTLSFFFIQPLLQQQYLFFSHSAVAVLCCRRAPPVLWPLFPDRSAVCRAPHFLPRLTRIYVFFFRISGQYLVSRPACCIALVSQFIFRSTAPCPPPPVLIGKIFFPFFDVFCNPVDNPTLDFRLFSSCTGFLFGVGRCGSEAALSYQNQTDAFFPSASVAFAHVFPALSPCLFAFLPDTFKVHSVFAAMVMVLDDCQFFVQGLISSILCSVPCPSLCSFLVQSLVVPKPPTLVFCSSGFPFKGLTVSNSSHQKRTVCSRSRHRLSVSTFFCT